MTVSDGKDNEVSHRGGLLIMPPHGVGFVSAG